MEVDVGQRQPDKLRNPKSCGVQQLQHRSVAKRPCVLAAHRREQQFDLSLGQGLRHALWDARPLDILGRVEREATLIDSERV